MPGAILLHQRDREWPVLGANIQRHCSIWFARYAMHLLVFLDEHVTLDFVLGIIGCRRKVRGASQDIFDGRFIVALYGLEKALGRLGGSSECLSTRLLLSETGRRKDY